MDALFDALRADLDAPDQADAVAARDAIRALAVPRMTGTPGAERVERWIRRRFERLGYDTRILPFTFSTLPARWGPPLVAALALIGSVAAAAALIGGRPLAAAAALAVPVLAALAAARLAPRLVARLPWGRLEARNLVFTRPGGRPRYVIAAHRDSKSQPVSTAARLAAGLVTGIGAAALGVLVVHGLAGLVAAAMGAWAEARVPETLMGAAREVFGPFLALDPPGFLVVICALVAAGGAAVLAFSWAGNDSPGALDNATGIAAALGLAERLAERDDIVYLITDAEELGLAGARAVAPETVTLLGAINLDGLDDDGPVHLVERYGFPRRGRAPHLAAALLTAADALDVDAVRHDAPLGLILEHAAYNDAGVPSLTVLKGRRRALGRIHRPADTAESIGGRGVATVVALVDGALHLLDAGRSGGPSHPLLPGREHPTARELRPEPGAARTPLFAHRPVAEPLPPEDDGALPDAEHLP
ncbi:MAG TPA: M28 family peptidase [Longimicrobiales bacterium]|nr:M28 family peptidase [Longimicrobiales bacterium]